MSEAPNIEPETTSHELAAVLFTDAVSFSAHMHENEARALAAISSDLDHLKIIASQHKGQVLKSLGDGLLVRFKSASDAVKCGMEFQRAMTHGYGPEKKKTFLRHRVGIHLGDMYVSDMEVMGDGVNIASRLQTIAEPGGICISQTVYDIVKNKVELKATQLGPKQLKNIADSISVYRILLDVVDNEDHDKKTRNTRKFNLSLPDFTKTYIKNIRNYIQKHSSFLNRYRLPVSLGTIGLILFVCIIPVVLIKSCSAYYRSEATKNSMIKLTDSEIRNKIIGRTIYMGKVLGIEVTGPIKSGAIKSLYNTKTSTSTSQGKVLYHATYIMNYQVRGETHAYKIDLTYDQNRYFSKVTIHSPFPR